MDGSLHDADWFVKVGRKPYTILDFPHKPIMAHSIHSGMFCAKKVFDRVRREFPHYRIAIFLIHASEEKVRERIAKRAKQTGRNIPEEMIRFGWGGDIKNIHCARSIRRNLVVVGYHSKHLSTR